MKKVHPMHFILVLTLLLLSSHIVRSQTHVSGVISSNTIWSPEGNPYILDGNVTVRNTSLQACTLSIRPGVIVKSNQGYSLIIGNGTNLGCLIANGTEDSTITFTSAKAVPTPGSWNGIYIYSGSYGSFKHCSIKYGGGTNGNIYCASTNLVVDSCVIDSSATYGISHLNTAVDAQLIMNNTILSGNRNYPLRINPMVNISHVQNNSANSNDSGYNCCAITNGTISTNRIWPGSNKFTYRITGDITVRNNSTAACTLSINKGSTIEFVPSTSFVVGYSTNLGCLIANGTKDSTIIFTSAKAVPTPGSWDGIYIYSGSYGSFKHCSIKYGGGTNGNINCASTNLVVDSCVIDSSATYGISYLNKEVNAQLVMNNTVFSGNRNFPLRINPMVDISQVQNNSAISNDSGYNCCAIVSGTITTNRQWPGTNKFTYRITGDIIVQKNTTAACTLSINPGSTLEFLPSTSLTAGNGTNLGCLIANGTKDSTITFTSAKVVPTPGSWDGIYIYSGSSGSFKHCSIKYGGGTNGNINCASTNYAVDSCIIDSSATYGIFLNNTITTLTLRNNKFRNNQYGIYFNFVSAPVTIRYNQFNNNSFAIYNARTGNTVVDARYCYWGENKSPRDTSDDRSTGGDYNPDGNGDKVTDKVLYRPWLTDTLYKLVSPQLVSPSNHYVNQSNSQNFSWEDVFLAESYRLQISADSLFSDIVYDDSTILTTSKQINSLSSAKKYFWRVRGKNTDGIGSWSDNWDFSTNPATLEIPLQIAPSNASINNPSDVMITWQSVPGASTYHLQLSKTSDFSELVIDDSTLTANAKSISLLSLNTTYYWHVNAKNISGKSIWSDVWFFTTNPDVPKKPMLVSPVNTSINQPISLPLMWNFDSSVITYRIQLSQDSNFTAIVLDDSLLVTAVKQLDSLDNSKVYYWRVAAKNISGNSLWSDTWFFSTIPSTPSKVTLHSPLSDIKIDIDSVSLNWVALPNIDKYCLEIYTDSLLTNRHFVDTTITDTLNVQKQLKNNVRYWWRVKAHNIAGWGEFSEVWNFHITIPTVAVIPIEHSCILQHANTNSAYVKYGLPKSSDVSITIYNIQGKVIKSVKFYSQKPGYYQHPIEINNYSKGFYILSFKAGNFKMKKTLSIFNH